MREPLFYKRALSPILKHEANKVEVSNNNRIPTIGEWEMDFLTRLRIRRDQRDHDRADIFAEANEIINMAQGIMATAHPQNVQAQNMLFALQQRLLILRREFLELDWVEEYDMELERPIWARARWLVLTGTLNSPSGLGTLQKKTRIIYDTKYPKLTSLSSYPI